jgi:hypothetical protein
VADHESGPSVRFDLHIIWYTFSGTILYSLAYSPETVLFLRWESCRW